MSFDPEEILKAVERIREAFNRAAEAESGTTTFKKLSKKIDALIAQSMDPSNQDADPKKLMMKMLPQVMDLQMTMQQLKREAETNPAVKAVLTDLARDIQEEVKTLLPLLGNNIPGIPGLPKIPGMDFGLPKEPPTPPAPRAPKPPRKPGGGFKF